MKIKRLSAVLAAAAVMPLSLNTQVLTTPAVVSAEDTASLPAWVPTDLSSALEFRNTYGSTHIENGLICIVHDSGNPQLSPHFEINGKYAQYDDSFVCEDTYYLYPEADDSSYIMVSLYRPTETGTLTISYKNDWDQTDYTFDTDAAMNVTETDIYSWLPDCAQEYRDYSLNHTPVSVKDNYVVFCLSYNAGTPYAWTCTSDGSECFELEAASECTTVSDIPLEGGAINTIYAYKAVKDGYSEISYGFGAVYTGGTTEETRTADCAVFDNARSVLLSGQMRVTLEDYDTGEPIIFGKDATPSISTDISYNTSEGTMSTGPILELETNPSVQENIGGFFSADSFSFSLSEYGLPKGYSFPDNAERMGYFNGALLPSDCVSVTRYDNGSADVVFRLKFTPTGDVNKDGSFDISDAVLLQKWLHALPDADLADWKAGDLCNDNRLDIYDLTMMKRWLADPTANRSFSFSVADGLFDQSNTDTLGLSAPSGAETVTVWKAENSGDHYCNGVCLAEYKGKIYCQWQSSETDEDSADTHVMYAVSSDSGRTWSEPKVLAENFEGGYCTSGGWLATDDKLVAYINFWDDSLSVKGGYAYCMTSADGINWSSPQQVKMADGSAMNAIFEQDPHVLASGRIVNAAHFQEGLMVCPIYTDDPSGISGWKKSDFTPTPNGTQSVELEPSIFTQSDGTLCMIFRDQNSSYTKLISYSLDDGETWSKAQSTTMPDARTKQSAGNLSDGTAFMAGCPVNNKLRSPLAVTLSKDGKTFDTAYLLRSNSSDPSLVYSGTAKREGFHYCKSLVAEGNLYVGYATNKEAVEITIVPESSISLN